MCSAQPRVSPQRFCCGYFDYAPSNPVAWTWRTIGSHPLRFAYTVLASFALADPFLWTNINLKPTKFARLVAHRAQSLPIHLSVAGPSQIAPRFCATILPRQVFYCSIYSEVKCTERLYRDQVNRYLSGRFSALETLLFMHKSGPLATSDVRALDAPQLKALSLHTWFISDWNARLWGISPLFQ